MGVDVITGAELHGLSHGLSHESVTTHAGSATTMVCCCCLCGNREFQAYFQHSAIRHPAALLTTMPKTAKINNRFMVGISLSFIASAPVNR